MCYLDKIRLILKYSHLDGIWYKISKKCFYSHMKLNSLMFQYEVKNEPEKWRKVTPLQYNYNFWKITHNTQLSIELKEKYTAC